MDQEFLTAVKDEDIPRMLFLSVNPTAVEDPSFDVASTPTFTDGGVMGLGNVGTVGEVLSSDGGSDSIGRLLLKFKAALGGSSISSVRRELHLRLLKLSTLELNDGTSLSTLESNFSDEVDHLSSSEEDVLEFTEVLERLQYPVPEAVRDRFNRIVASKKIPIRRAEGSNKTFFVYAENKIMMKVCNLLSSLEVHQIYTFLRESKAVDEDVNMKDFVSQQCPSPEMLERVAGLKDVAFYYLILTLMKKKMMNRLYTHKLTFLLDHLKTIHKENKKECSRIDHALSLISRYPIASHPPGLCFIFVMTEDRSGALKDLDRVKDLFEKHFQYDVCVVMDPTAERIKSIISKVKAARNKFYDSLVVWFMGHGSKSYLNVKEGEIHRRIDLIEPFMDIEWFYKKPKLFFIQACAIKENRKRFSTSAQDTKVLSTQVDTLGWKLPAGQAWQKKYADYTDVSNINCFADTLISYATMWYQPAARGEEGSLYVDTLVDQLKEYGSSESIENVLRRVHYNVNTISLRLDDPGLGEVQWKQAPYFESSLQKEFIFPKSKNA